jgi:hypothetical protein
MTITVHLGEEVYIVASWSGGPYIDLARAGVNFPAEVINVWDYEIGKPVIEVAQKAFDLHVLSWVKSYDEDQGPGALLHDVTKNWYGF